jgi:arginase family enzyme
MENKETPRLALLGFPLDPDERQGSIDEKLSLLSAPADRDDPREAVVALLSALAGPSPWRDAGSLETPGWLRPQPPVEDRPALAVENFVRFTDGDGCRAASRELAQRVDELPPGEVPCLVAVEHSLSGGLTMALSRRLGAENLTLVVLDSHLDAVPLPVMAGAIAFDLEHNPHSLHHPDDPFIFGRVDAYCASSYLHHLLAEELILPQNLYVIGLPPARAYAIKDPRIRAYVSCWTGLQKRGVKIITKKDLGLNPGKLIALIKQIKTSHVQVSIDMDVGAGNAVEGVRFSDWLGLSRAQVLKVAGELVRLLARGPHLAGLDLCEFNPRLLPAEAPAYRLAAELIGLLAWGRPPSA